MTTRKARPKGIGRRNTPETLSRHRITIEGRPYTLTISKGAGRVSEGSATGHVTGAEPVARPEFEALLERVEALEDALDMQAAVAKRKTREYLPAELVDRLLAGESPVRIWREHRGLTLASLAEKSGVGLSYISEIETGKKPGSVAAMRSLAAALGVDLDDLVAAPG